MVQRCVPAWFATGTAMCSFFWMPEPGGPGGLRRQVSGERKEPRGVLYLMRNDNPRQPGSRHSTVPDFVHSFVSCTPFFRKLFPPTF